MEASALLTEAYDAFNARDIERALAVMHPEVDWPNGMQGGYVHGHAAVRDLSGGVVTDRMVQHVYRIENGAIRHMEIGT